MRTRDWGEDDDLDVEVDVERDASGEEEPTSPRALSRPRLHLMFVDDDPLAEMTLRRAFRRLGLEGPLTIAHDGLEALEILRDPWFPLDRCVLLLDLKMPRMDGHELLAEIRRDPDLSAVRVVVMTTSDDARDVQRAYALGAAAYFVKPVSFSDFVQQVGAVYEHWSRAMLPLGKGRSGVLPIP